MREKKKFCIGTGITSMLMIFVVLCLTTFGILSYTSANAEVALTSKNSHYVTAYYDAYSSGAVALSYIDKIIYEASKEDEANYFQKINEEVSKFNIKGCTTENVIENGKMSIILYIDITDKQQLYMKIDVNGMNDAKRFKVVTSYIKTEIGESSYEEQLPDMWGN